MVHLVCLLLWFFCLPCMAWGEQQEEIAVPSSVKKEGVGGFSAKGTVSCNVIIQGNTFLTDEDLRAAAEEELSTYQTDGFLLSDIDDAAFQMEYTYRLAGFADAIVTYRVEEPLADECRVFFDVHEGNRQIIDSIVLEGNSAFDSSPLLLLEKSRTYSPGKQLNILPYVELEITSLVKKIRNYYLAEGYLDVSVEVEKTRHPDSVSSVEIRIHVQEGKQYSINAVTFTGDVLPEFNEELEGQKNELIGQKFQQRHRLLLRIRLEELYKNGGYADVAIQTSEEKEKESGAVHLQADIISGTLVAIHDITVSGLSRTQETFVYKKLKFQAGEPYSQAKVRESFSSLYETGLFQSVNIELEKGPQLQSRSMSVDIKEKRNRELFVEPGWGSYELLRLSAGYRDWNLFGNGHRYRLQTGVSVKGRSVEMAFTEPRLLGTDIEMDFPIHYRYREEPTFTTENTGFAVYLSKKFPRNIQITGGYKTDISNTTNIDVAESASGTEDSYTTAIMTMQLVRDTRDDYFFPTKGYRGFASVDIASPLVGSTLSFYRLKAGARVFRPTGKSSVLGMRYAAGIILPVGDQEGIPVGERFYNGGENSVRSFKESDLGPLDTANQPLGGAAYNVFTLEWRYKFSDAIATSFFVDTGNVAPNGGQQLESLMAGSKKELIDATLQDFFRDMKIGIGAGVQYLLPVGPARLDLAFNPNADKETDEDEYVIHFSIGMAF